MPPKKINAFTTKVFRLPSAFDRRTNQRRISGFSLIELLIAMAIFVIIGGAIFLSFVSISDVINRTRLSTLTTSLLNKQIEIVRNLPYEQIGTVGGSPAGVMLASSTAVYEGQSFSISSYVRNFDDVFDGTVGGIPHDTAPADYKLVEIQVLCTSCFDAKPLTFTTWTAPKRLEGGSKNGALFVDVFDADGQPLQNANVSIINTSLTPNINISDVTNVDGMYTLVDTPTSTNAYRIVVSKPGYSTERTYAIDSVNNPNPVPIHATVASQQVTEIGFTIDRLSDLRLVSQDYLCAAVPSIGLSVTGDTLIGSDPDIPAYSTSTTTNASGVANLGNLAWDTYTFINTSASYDLAGTIPANPFDLDAGVSSTVTFLMEPATTNSLLVTVTDDNGEAISGPTVTIQKTGVNLTLQAGERQISDTNWPTGSYTGQSGLVETLAPTGQLSMKKIGGVYPTSTEWLISRTFDFGTATTTLHSLSWNPITQPNQTGLNSLQFQIAVSNSPAGPWTYVGPSGTTASFYTTSPVVLGNQFNNFRYLRYKAYLSTANTAYTPTLTDITLSFASACIPEGQAFFSGIPTGDYTVTVTKSGFSDASSTVTVGSGWQEDEEVLYP